MEKHPENRCVIFSAGSYYGLPFELEDDDYIIAADAGYKICEREGIKPDLIIGDFDSSEEPRLTEEGLIESDTTALAGTITSEQNKTSKTRTNISRHPVEKDDTDTMLAVKDALEKGYREIHILGGFGGERIDHTIANLQTLSYIAENGARGYMYDSNFIFTAIKNESIILEQQKEDGILSVFCVGADAREVSISGAKYCIEGETLSASFPLGVSNHFIGKPVTVRVGDGCLLIGAEF